MDFSSKSLEELKWRCNFLGGESPSHSRSRKSPEAYKLRGVTPLAPLYSHTNNHFIQSYIPSFP